MRKVCVSLLVLQLRLSTVLQVLERCTTRKWRQVKVRFFRDCCRKTVPVIMWRV